LPAFLLWLRKGILYDRYLSKEGNPFILRLGSARTDIVLCLIVSDCRPSTLKLPVFAQGYAPASDAAGGSYGASQ